VHPHCDQGLAGLTGRAATTTAEDGGSSDRGARAIPYRSLQQSLPCRGSCYGLDCSHVRQERLPKSPSLAGAYSMNRGQCEPDTPYPASKPLPPPRANSRWH